MAHERIRISSDWGEVTAELADNAATKALVGMFAGYRDARSHAAGKDRRLAIAPAGDHAQTEFTKGTLGLWSSDHFVIYYREGRVPQPGIILNG